MVNHNYDNALRLTRKDIIRALGVEGTTFENFAYDGLSRMTSAQNDFSTLTMQYDSLGNLLQENQNGKLASSQYNELSFRDSLTYPNGRQISYVPDTLNRIDQIKEGVNVIADYNYIGSSRVKSRQYQPNTTNPITLTVEYDGNRRAINYQHIGTKVYTPVQWNKKGKPTKYEWKAAPVGFEYTFDKEDNKLYEKQLPEGKGDAFLYDAIYRLSSVKYGVPDLDPTKTYAQYTTFDKKEDFTLDGVGNRQTVQTDSTTITYQTNQLNQYTAIDGLNPTYDLNGNMTFDGYNTIVYDYANRPVRFENSIYIVEVTYDSLGRRVQKKITEKATSVITTEGYVLDGTRVISDLDEFGVPTKDYIWGIEIDELLATAKGRSTNYDFYLHNSLGSITHVVNKNAEVEESYKYTVYGSVIIYDRKGEEAKKSKSKNRYLFTGREYDAETGVYYYRARYYSAELGRFLQQDPMEYDELLNLYTYVANNSINRIDPFGLGSVEGEIKISFSVRKGGKKTGEGEIPVIKLQKNKAENDLVGASKIKGKEYKISGTREENKEGEYVGGAYHRTEWSFALAGELSIYTNKDPKFDEWGYKIKITLEIESAIVQSYQGWIIGWVTPLEIKPGHRKEKIKVKEKDEEIEIKVPQYPTLTAEIEEGGGSIVHQKIFIEEKNIPAYKISSKKAELRGEIRFHKLLIEGEVLKGKKKVGEAPQPLQTPKKK